MIMSETDLCCLSSGRLVTLRTQTWKQVQDSDKMIPRPPITSEYNFNIHWKLDTLGTEGKQITFCMFPYDLLKRLTFQLNDPVTVTIVLTRTWTRLKFHTTVLITVGVTCPHLGLAVVLFAHVTSLCSSVSSCDDMMFSGVSTLLDWNCLGKYWPLSHCTFVHTASNR